MAATIKFIDYGDVVSQIIKDDVDKYDIEYVESDAMSMEDETGLINLMGNKDKKFFMTKQATQQFCRAYNIPYDFWFEELDRYDKSYIFNKFVKNEKAFYVRCRKPDGNRPDTIRAILSDKFVPLDNRFISEQFKEFIDRNDYKISNFHLGELSMHFRMIMESEVIEMGNGKPDTWYGGIHISNSEVGLRSTALDGMLFRLICSNGSIMTKENKHFLNVNHRGSTEETFKEKYNAAIWDAISFVRGASDSLRNTKKFKIDEDTNTALIESMEDIKLSDVFIDKVVKEFENSGNTLYDFVNAMTLKSQEMEWDRRYDVERLAGGWLVKQLVA